MKHLLLPALLLSCCALLPACSGGEAPRMAEFVPPAPAESDFGALRVRYNALPTLSMSEAVAREYGVERDPGTALLVVALRDLSGGEEKHADGQVDAVAVDLSGARQKIALRSIEAGGYTDHIGTLRISPRSTYRFELSVQSGGRSGQVKFQRNF